MSVPMVNAGRFYGRERELQLLHKFQADVCERAMNCFVVVTGRRRIGKTRLIEEALKRNTQMPTISVYVASQLANTNLTDFVDEIKKALDIPYPLAINNYKEALTLVFKEAERRPIALVLDEFQNVKSLPALLAGLLSSQTDFPASFLL